MKFKTIKPLLPELFILASLLYYWMASSWLNPIAITLIVIISFQILKQKIVSGIIIGFIFILLNLYMVLALISELSEFKSVTDSFKIMLLVGSFYLGINIISGSFMLIKYIKKANAKQIQETTIS
ncbi:hypothetical protein [uncultured Winogradskyella sp.]|uniref:hypothetical protein n=1 Tax=uncultured Winogradskyella sp. TaxID=395353 RepID=UPI0026347695|nr:hypothetical protein [uncultured Winogradskyella sp.]